MPCILTNAKTIPKLIYRKKFYALLSITAKEEYMEKLLAQLKQLVATNIEDVVKVEEVNKEMGYMLYITLKDGQKILLSLIDAKL